ncbi:type I secretion membrane fusion protein, HlyD family [Rhodobacteraceae bacterium KLH11]|nr:type I secretion membrane fusion protein, HlyD family [Rhodobacteraceae bacterium KLH11]
MLFGLRRDGREREFLPSALEVLETPPNPISRMLGLLIGTLVVSGIAWSYFGRVDIVVVAQGQLVPVGGVKVIQPFESGTVRSIEVYDGKRVQAGDVLIELDPTDSLSDAGQLAEELAEASANIARLRVLLDHIDGEEGGVIEPSAYFDQNKLRVSLYQLQADKIGFEAQVSSFQAEIERNFAEEAAILAELEKQQALLPLLEVQETELNSLLEKGLTPKQRVLEMRARRIETSQDIIVQQYRLAEIQASTRAQGRTLEKFTADTRSEFVAQLIEAEKTFNQTKLALQTVERQKELNSLKAPVNGTVQQLSIHTVGGVVSPAEPLMVVVPSDAELEVKSKILNKDKGFIQPGMQAEVKIDAFPFTKYGTVTGKLKSISEDAVEDQNLGLVFDAVVSIDKQQLTIDGNDILLTPGMSVQAELKTGTRRIIEFVLTPILRYKDEAFRER